MNTEPPKRLVVLELECDVPQNEAEQFVAYIMECGVLNHRRDSLERLCPNMPRKFGMTIKQEQPNE